MFGWLMQNRNLSIIFTGLIAMLLIGLGGCKRAYPTEISAISLASSQEPTVEGTPTPVLAEAYPQPTEPIHPFSTIPLLPTATEQAYPQPSVEISSPFPQPAQGSGQPYPPGVPSPTINIGGISTASTEPTKSPEATATVTEPPKTSTPTETATEASAYPAPGGGETKPYPAPEVTETNPYPAPEVTETNPYPAPEITDTQAPYEGPVTNTPIPSTTSLKSPTPSNPSGTVSPIPTGGTGTSGPTPTELPPRSPLSPPPPGSSVVIWHSWGSAEADMLQTIIDAFRRSYPDITFRMRYIPLDELHDAYYEAAYLGQGPSLLFGPAVWGPELFEGGLISDLSPYIPFELLTDINPAALSSGEYCKSLISLPLSQHGMVMYRNTSIISSAAQSFEELIFSSHEAIRGGIVGSYLERGSYFSSADILGLGGNLMDEDGYPAFNDPSGLAWFHLLSDYDTAGAVTFNTNRDLDMFKRMRVGIIIDGTWNISMLSQIIGAENLAIDPWPTYESGHLSGWVEADSVFLNTNVTNNDRFAALSFIGYLLTPDVQVRLAEVGHIPSVITANPRDRLLQQALVAFSLGVPFPITVDSSMLNLYWQELDKAIQSVFNADITPSDALKTASSAITQSLNQITNKP
jgi:ABC-type glycerol-3-phosphate transport system substrate-binding protein